MTNRCLKFISITGLYLVMTLSHALGNDTTYNISDLSALQVEEAFDEYFKHALDIRPSERTTNWTTMLEDMGLKYINKLLKQKTIATKDQNLITDISKWPYFKSNELFIQKRDLVLTKIIDQCFSYKAKETCLQLSKYYFYDFPHELTFSFELIKILDSHKVPKPTLWPYAQKFAQNKFSEFYCHKSPLKELLSEKILSMAWKKKKPLAIHSDCLKKVLPTFKKILRSSDAQYRSAAFNVLKAHNNLAPNDYSSYFLLEYLDDNLKSIKDIDMALKELDNLSKDINLRESIQRDLSKLDLLPGKIFNSNKKSMAKIRLLNRHFPEYIDLYAKTCLSYLDGSVKFNKGNPTPHCHSLFTLDKKLNILPALFHKSYSKATAFTR